ncbi:MAG: ATP-binding protein [Deinococcales bacterium]
MVSANLVPNSKLADIWDYLSLTEYEKQVIEGLQIIEPRIMALSFVAQDSERSGLRAPYVSLKGSTEPIALKSMGDGTFKILNLLIMLLSSKESILCIDEFENGLHWSVQPKVWQAVFRLAKKLDVQVFATTHSRDCIAGFNEVWQDQEDEGCFLRLDREGEDIYPTYYPPSSLNDALEMDIEVR